MSFYHSLIRQVTWLNISVILVCAILFFAISFILLHNTEKNIIFIQQELKGVEDHARLMDRFAALHRVDIKPDRSPIEALYADIAAQYSFSSFAPNPLPEKLYQLMLIVGDESNLILDPELGSYYLMNIVIRLLPEMIHAANEVQAETSLIRHLLSQLKRSLHVVESRGIPVSESWNLVALLEKNETYDQSKINILSELYEATSIV